MDLHLNLPISTQHVWKLIEPAGLKLNNRDAANNFRAGRFERMTAP
jgi:hypothetical protein